MIYDTVFGRDLGDQEGIYWGGLKVTIVTITVNSFLSIFTFYLELITPSISQERCTSETQVTVLTIQTIASEIMAKKHIFKIWRFILKTEQCGKKYARNLI